MPLSLLTHSASFFDLNFYHILQIPPIECEVLIYFSPFINNLSVQCHLCLKHSATGDKSHHQAPPNHQCQFPLLYGARIIKSSWPSNPSQLSATTPFPQCQIRQHSSKSPSFSGTFVLNIQHSTPPKNRREREKNLF